MGRGLRTLSILSATILLVLPLKASSAIPAVAAIAAVVSVFGGVYQAWKGFNVGVVGARSAAFAQADEIWVSEPPNISRDELEEGTFEATAANWNIGHESSISIASVAAPSGNAITVRAETKWEGFALSPEINMTEMKLVSEDGVLWGKGFAYGTFKGIVTEEYPLLDRHEAGFRVAEIPFRFTISDLLVPYERDFDLLSFDLNLRAWKMDGEATSPQESTWHEHVGLASVSIDRSGLDAIRVEGGLTEDNLGQIDLAEQESFQIRLREPIEREVALRVPFPDSAERVVIVFRIEAKGAFQVGKR